MQHNSEPHVPQLVASMEDLNLNSTDSQLPSHSPDPCQLGWKPPLSSSMACAPTSFPQAYRIPNSWFATSAGLENASTQERSASAILASLRKNFNYDQEVDAILNHPSWWLNVDPSEKMQWKSMLERFSPTKRHLYSSMPLASDLTPPDWDTCAVCCKEKVSIIIPCFHLCLCKECEKKFDTCFICKKKKSGACYVLSF